MALVPPEPPLVGEENSVLEVGEVACFCGVEVAARAAAAAASFWLLAKAFALMIVVPAAALANLIFIP